MLSGQQPKSLDPDLPTFFLDRSVGRREVATALCGQGAQVQLMGNIYPDDGQHVPDPEWIRRCGREDWVALTKDYAALYDHGQAIEAAVIRLFVLTNANVTGKENVRRIMDNWSRIVARAKKPGPYVYAILPNSLEKRWPAI